MGGLITRFFPPSPAFTENGIRSLAGRVYIVTGRNKGVGLEVVKIIYAQGGTVYVTSHLARKIAAKIQSIKSICPERTGNLNSLIIVSLSDLTTIPACASASPAQESRFDVLFKNVGVSRHPRGTVLTATNYTWPVIVSDLSS
jgi:NAD(P)-dependent dehydrogenase (short-subunit alcohol dehydrogenase family)